MLLFNLVFFPLFSIFVYVLFCASIILIFVKSQSNWKVIYVYAFSILNTTKNKLLLVF